MHWLSIIYFFAVTLSTGMLVDLLVNNWQADWLEKLVMRLGVGLAAMSVEGVIFNLLHIPLDYRVFLGTGVLIFIGALAGNKQLRSIDTAKIAPALGRCWKNKIFWYALFMLLLFAITAKMYIGGTFRYDYFEDTDPWGYTAVADYIGQAKTFSAPYYSVQYNEPYTQGYQIVMGVLSQTNDSIYWTMKCFSTLIISFGVLFMYYFARRFSRNEEVAVLAAFFLFAVPAWVSHFIYSLHYNMTLFVVLLYVLARLMDERREIAVLPVGSATEKEKSDTADFQNGIAGWMPVGIVVYASMIMNHLNSVFHASIFCFVLIVTRILAERRIDWQTIMVFIGGGLLSLLYFIPAIVRHWWLTTAEIPVGGMGGVEKLFPLMRFVTTTTGAVTMLILLAIAVFIYRSRHSWRPALEGWLAVGNRGVIIWLCGLALVFIVLLLPIHIVYMLGTADRLALGVVDRYYVVSDFFSASSARNMINNPVGLGFVLMSAVAASFLLASARIFTLFKPVNAWIAVSYAWIITAFLLVLGKYFSIAIVPFRAWTFLGLFASLFAAWGIVTFIRAFSGNYWILLGVMVLLAAIVIPTSFIPKYQINTAIWKDSTIGTPESRALFTWMRNGGIPKNSVVAHLCGNSEFLSGYDMNPPLWNEVFHPRRGVEKPYFVVHPLEITPEAYTVLKNAQVEYVTIGASCLWQDPPPPEEEESFGARIGETMDRYMTDSRLTLVRKTRYEQLFKLN
jgi:hypothetical protein